MQGISTDLENLTGLFSVSTGLNIRDDSLSKIKTIGIAHTPEISMAEVLVKS